MNKPDSLRAALTAAIPEFARNPDRLHVFIEHGSIATTAANSLSFEYAYTLDVVVTDYAGHADHLIVPVIAWLKVHQPEMLLNRELCRDGFRFQAELLDNGKSDVEILLKLTERVGVLEMPEGYEIRHFAEPSIPG
ncbi:phage tail protein [Burkholderia cepacia]|uniref:phage tail protein n=1 Tax=Burkholderia cepacia TaxID=292 RepID=UPI00075DC4CE|nr:phage tail protein [Burkholderia cepacia]KWD57241.1 phage tail protein [Burkholderia cepacia]KWD83088.1 phage tail protein [Burkholderia cepacia]MCA7893132.1 phage tail protein [Burkholderia cepacia]